MPFGLTNAPRTFTKAMKYILDGLEYVKIYMDDILIHSKDIEFHYEHLKSVLNKLLEAGASINFEKSVFNVSEVRFLGHLMSKDGIKADISNLKDFSVSRPTTKKKLQRMLGYLNWFRPFVKDYAILTSNLYEKLKKNEGKFTWSDLNDKSLNEIMKRIKSNQVLSHPNLNDEFLLEVDASKMGMGATLYQNHKIIGFYSSLFKNSELNYTNSEKEFYAIIKAVNHFRQLILGAKIVIRTDHANNLPKKDLTKRQQRWSLLLQEYDFKLCFVKGKENLLADFLSRNFKDQKTTEQIMLIRTKAHISRHNESNKFTALVMELKHFIENKTDYTSLINKIREIHEILTHPGYKMMKNTISEMINIDKIKSIIKRVCDECEKCQKEKDNFFKTSKVEFIESVPKLYECIAIDIKGPIKSKHFRTVSKARMFYLLVITEFISRYTEVSVIENIDSSTICNSIKKNWFEPYGYPKVCITDNGRQFNSKNFRSLMKNNYIKHINTSPHNPSGNSVVERINKEMGLALRIFRNSPLNECITSIWRRVNLTVNRITGHSPYRIFFNKEHSDIIEYKQNIVIEEIQRKILSQFKRNIKKENDNKKNFNIKKGDLILKKNFDPDKISPRFKGPFPVVSIGKLQNSVTIDEGSKISKVSVKNIKIFKRGGRCESAKLSPSGRSMTKSIFFKSRI
ncbi:Transposon Tf2-6 polyprotein [Dictyocoela roeselum]|nr:Transposon Tf2-6 polyprotein [Dictyocoela roeselum]